MRCFGVGFRIRKQGGKMKNLTALFLATVIVMPVGNISVFAQRGGPGVNQGQGRGPLQGPRIEHSNRGPQSGPAVTNRSENAKGEGKRPDMTVANSIARNEKLSARLQGLLPMNTTLTDAAAGFKNRGQFIAALHVSQNLGIPFDQLKAAMIGEGTQSLAAQGEGSESAGPKSLGQAINELRPELTETQVTVEVQKAEEQAQATESGKPTS
jgi:hypothetical protein